jgi:hypothetical protein
VRSTQVTKAAPSGKRARGAYAPEQPQAGVRSSARANAGTRKTALFEQEY